MKLRNWWFFEDDGDVVCYGYVEGSSRHSDGKLISTSRITGVVSTSPLVIDTYSGSKYTLEEPDYEGHKASIRSGCKRLGIRL